MKPVEDSNNNSPLNLAALKLELSIATEAPLSEKSLLRILTVRLDGEVNEVTCISSPFEFSIMRLFLSFDKKALTPVFPEKLLIEVAKFVKSVERTEALIETLEFVPDLLLRVKEIVPSDEGAGTLILVRADA